MKNSKATYFLLVVVAIIWGLIGYRIWSHFHDSDIDNSEMYIFTDTTIVKPDMNEITELKLNYGDPFLKSSFAYVRRSETTKRSSSNQNHNIRRRIGTLNNTKPMEKKIIWPDIIYSGLILNDKSNEELGLIEVNKESFLVRKGEIRNDVLIKEIYADSIIVTFQNEQRTFGINKK